MVAFLDGDFVGVHDVFVAAEGCGHHEHGGVGEVEVGEQGGADGEVVGRENEFVGPSLVELHVAAHADGGGDAAED